MGHHVLVPLDRSSPAEEAFEYVLQDMQDEEITLLHVINPVSSFGYGSDDYFDAEGYQTNVEQQREAGEELLESYREKAAESDVVVDTILTTGKPSQEILETIESEDIDEVVMGSQGRSGVGRVLFGSVAETVTRRSPVPVTIVR